MAEGTPSVCAGPIKQGPNKGSPTATGTTAGYYRHRTAKEPPCEPCRIAHCDEVREWATERKDEVNARRADHYRANPTPTRERARAWYEANSERANLAAADWSRRNPERRAEIVRRWDQRNADRRRQQSKEWRERNPDKIRAAMSRRRARLRSAPSVQFTAEQLDQRMSMFGFRCWMCDGPFEHVDHVKPISRGGWHCLANLRPSCARCNRSKAGRWPVDTRYRFRMSPLIR